MATEESFIDDVTTASGTDTDSDDANGCLKKRYWSYFLASSFIVLFLGLIVILSYRLLLHFCGWSARRHKTPAELAEDDHHDQHVIPGVCTKLKWHAEGWISGQTTTGKVMVRRAIPYYTYYSSQVHVAK